MVNWDARNDRERRKAVLKTLVGTQDTEITAALDNAEFVQEAARFVRQMREAAELTQERLGLRLGVSQARISEIERGGAPEGVSYALLRRIATACGFANWPPPPMRAADPDEQWSFEENSAWQRDRGEPA